MAKSDNLRTARKARQDEFYTQLIDIEKELKHYKEEFMGKIIFCNCDDPYESNFFKYFAMNFNFLKLKKLIATCYDSSPIVGEQLSLFPDKRPYMIQITEVIDENGDGAIDLADVEYLLKNKKNTTRKLKNGDFRSEECVKLLQEADIVVTNPPFSLFREYVEQLITYGKKFIIIGNQNAITYKEIFPLLKGNKMWLGYGFNGGNAYFKVLKENGENYVSGVYNDKTGLVKFRNCVWFTNIDIKKRHEELILYKKYSPNEYPRYDNFDAINVDKVVDIPCDYEGYMGVPITFLDKYNPEQFEIVRFRKGNDDKDLSINGKCPYFRIIIKKRQQVGKEEDLISDEESRKNAQEFLDVLNGKYPDRKMRLIGIYRRDSSGEKKKQSAARALTVKKTFGEKTE